MARIPEKAWVAKDHFYHVERLYRIENGAPLQGVVRVSFGSFDRPEHKYLLIGRDGVDYFPHAPVPTHANRAAHEALEEWLCPTS
jgi:tRNA (guanine-N7-)-methyltransferase